MTTIHPTALIDDSAMLGHNVNVGPYSVIGPNVVIGDDSKIMSHVVITRDTEIGKNNHIFQFSSIGEDTPDLKYKGEETRLIIGDNNIIREGVTIHRGTIQDRSETTIGNNNLLMAYVHIGHDSIVDNHCILVNNASLAGHVHVHDYAILSGYTLVHQFCQIGSHSFTGMGTAVGKDLPAFVMATGAPAVARSINAEGIKRRGFSTEDVSELNRAFKLVYKKGFTLDNALDILKSEFSKEKHMVEFIQSLENSTRGIIR